MRETYSAEFQGTTDIAVCLSCHAPYLGYLPDAVAHVDGQVLRPGQRILAYDGFDWPEVCEILRNQFPGWLVIGGSYHNPNPLRNRAAAMMVGTWGVFMDADDFMHREYIASIAATARNPAAARAAMINADLRFSDGHAWKVPDKFDYWGLRLRNTVSAASAWRLDALRFAGGWPADTECYDDWSLALELTRRGWKALKQPVPILCRSHPGHRRDDAGRKEYGHKYRHRTFAVVTLFSGRLDILKEWAAAVSACIHPGENFRFYGLDNSGQGVPDSCGFENMQRCRRKCDPVSHPLARHWHVPHLYNEILPGLHEDFILTIEDDVIPPPSAFRKCLDAFRVGGKVGAVSAVYPSRSGGGRIVAARGNVRTGGGDYWRDIYTEADISGQEDPFEVAFVGGGFTLWHNALIKRFLPFRFESYDDKASGWDSCLCRDIRQAGYQILLHPGVWCEHKFC